MIHEAKEPERQEEGPSTMNKKRVEKSILEWNVAELSVHCKSEKRTVLQHIAGRAESGDFVAILGPSGSGKTSLLECLSLRNRRFLGALHLNGRSVGSDYFTKAAIVYQNELLFGFFTVREHLTFHSIARMSKRHTKVKMQRRVEEVISELNLDKCADTIIGGTDPMYMLKGISGGERKRLMIATELLLCPQVLLLDEPTSGLDSFMSESVVQSLTTVVIEMGALVMASLHSPSSTLAQHFTHVLLLTADGRCAFMGPYSEALSHFRVGMGLVVPPGFSTVEFLLDLVSRRGSMEDTTKRIDQLVDYFERSAYRAAYQPLPCEDGHHRHKGVSGLQASTWTLTCLNVWRMSLMVRRNGRIYLLWTVTHLVVGVIFGLLYMGGRASDNWRNLIGLLLNTCDTALFLGGVALVVTFPAEWVKVVREYLSGANAMGPFMAGYLFYNLVFLWGTVTFSTTIYWMCGLIPTVTAYLQFVATLLLVTAAAEACCMFLSSFSANMLVGLALIFFPFITFSGVLYQSSTVPPYLKWIQQISIVNYGFAALLGTQAKGMPPELREFALAFTEVNPDHVPRYMMSLVVLVIGFYLLTYISLRIRLVMLKQSL